MILAGDDDERQTKESSQWGSEQSERHHEREKLPCWWPAAGAFFKIKGARTGDFTLAGRVLPHFCSVCNVP
jgi:hypothetical protein